METLRMITDFEIVDLGIHHSDYFQGFGVLGTSYANCCYGIGNDPREALDDCLDQAAGISDNVDWEEVEQLIFKQYPAFKNARLIKKNTVRCDCDENEDCDCELPWYHVGMRWND